MWRIGPGLVVAFFLVVVSACGGGDTTSSADGASSGSEAVGGDSWSVAEVAPSLEFLGDLAVVRSAPVATTFDASAASLELDDGVIVDVSAGAFVAPTEVTAVIVDLDFAQYADNAPLAVAYVLSTDVDVDLAASVVLEVPEPPDTVRVMQPIDDEWRLVEVPSGATTRIPITHFSEVPTVVAKSGISNAVIKGSDPDGEAPGDFLTACLYTVTTLLADGPDLVGESDTSLSLQLAYSSCTRALVTKFSPSGVRVEVSCVGDKIGGDVDLLAAIDACVADTDSAPTDGDAEQISETSDPIAAEGEPPVADNDTIDAAASYRFAAVLDLSDETGTLRYDWDGPFSVDDEGAITGTGTVVGSSISTCESPGFEGTVSGPYAYTVEGAFDIAGRAADDQLEIRLANASAQFTLDQGDQAILCVDISRDLALEIGRLPLGDSQLGLGLLEVPASGGSTIIDTGEGIVFTVEVTPS